MSTDPVEVAAQLVAARFPSAHAAFLGGSAPTARRTRWSDLDVVVVLDGPPAPFRETTRHSGQLVEWFVQTPESLRHYWRLDASRRRTPLLRMVAEGVPLVLPQPGDEPDPLLPGVSRSASRTGAGPQSPTALAEIYQAEAVALLAAGPPDPGAAAVDYQRYLVTDLLDDLRGATDPVEVAYLAATIVLSASDLLLLAENRWSARGKWLPRRLAEVDPGLPGRLVEGHRAVLTGDDRELLLAAVRAVLDHTGGPLQEGFRVAGTVPALPIPHSQ
ncbi:nucleotidyltransferase domain-containing protein [Actinoplanes derwentensis]|uniref:nucleotidyltransferase domain-containing protein n=1 Tax=Actinoplanes derwentensis TaxID=113562 RepID=UPI0012FE0452|nr:nucleotidyltransferase domain-containing protein [Actinoplanes derwentensis]